MVHSLPGQPGSSDTSSTDSEGSLIVPDDKFWKQVVRVADQTRLKRRSVDAPKVNDGHSRKRLRRLSVSPGLSAPDRAAASESDNSHEEIEVQIPKALHTSRTGSRERLPHLNPAGWWERLQHLDPETFAIVEDRLGPDFHPGMDDPARAWKNVPPRQFWGFPDCLIQVDAHTLVSKRRFTEIVETRIQTAIAPEDIDYFIGDRNVIMRTPSGYWSRAPFGRGRFKLPEIIAQADADTFVSGEKLKMKLDSAGVKFGQLLYEEQALLLNRNAYGKSTGNFSELGLYARGYRKLSRTQKELLNLPYNVQSKLSQDTTDTPYRDFTDDLYPRAGERLYPKGSEDFAKQLTSGFRDLKKANAGWADEAAAVKVADMRRGLLARKPNTRD
ncbi:hypothetical protein [Rhizobium terrae]|uniref:hypothetical protein n=1 Tax=Rhizobium terrae TaxID=2171756 RepID=UPI0013C2FDF1|nr:hypothetical protein [Rhizobium terrae]